MGAEERIEDTKLVHHDKEIIWGHQLVSGNVSTDERMTCNSLCQHLVQRSRNLTKESLSIACPVWSELLAAKEK